MKKSLFIICLSFCFMFCFINSVTFAFDSTLYLTSDGFSYSLDNVLMYDSDFYDKDFKSDTEVIDFIYQTGYNRTSSVYDYNYDGSDSRVDIKGTKLTKDEIELFIKYFYYICKLKDIKSNALSKTQELYGYTTEDSIANAFQHAYWIALMYFHLSPSFAIQEGYAHEEYDENDPMSKHMDLYNDDVSYNECSSINYTNDDSLAITIKDLVSSGKCIYIKRNYSYPVKKIYYLSSDRIDTIYAVGDFYCYTNSDTPYGLPKVTIVKTKYEIMEGSLMEV